MNSEDIVSINKLRQCNVDAIKLIDRWFLESEDRNVDVEKVLERLAKELEMNRTSNRKLYPEHLKEDNRMGLYLRKQLENHPEKHFNEGFVREGILQLLCYVIYRDAKAGRSNHGYLKEHFLEYINQEVKAAIKKGAGDLRREAEEKND